MKRFLKFILLFTALSFAGVVFAQSELRLPTVLSSNMVVQQNSRMIVWGWAAPDAKITVSASWTPKAVKTKADGKGEWSVTLRTPAASFDAQTLIVKSGTEEITLSNVLVGEVWLCSGQSNMAYKVSQTTDLKNDMRRTAESGKHIRLYNTGRIFAAEPQDDVKRTRWTTCNSESVGNFSAVAWAFGKKLQAELNVPVGLINASYGGTFIEGWLSKKTLEEDPRTYWLMRSVGIINKSGNKWRNKQCYLYNANIYPIRKYSIAGVIWYQGCNNVGYNQVSYKESLAALIDSWRDDFRNASMPFYIVQLVPHVYSGCLGAYLRECQDYVSRNTEHSALVVTNDCRDIPGDIHPRQKNVIGERLANCALGEHYGRKDVIYASPSYSNMSINGRSVTLTFDNVPSYLKCTGDKIVGFQIGQMKNDRQIEFFLADAEFDAMRRSIKVSSPKCSSPVSVRYCFDEEVGNVFSAEGLPLAPFRTDDNNESSPARGYVEMPQSVPVRFEGDGYEKVVFTAGSKLWSDRPHVLVEGQYPAEFDGFEMMIADGVQNEAGEKSRGGKITALADGRIYCVTRVNSAILKAAAFGWRVILPATIFGGRRVGTKADGTPEYKFLDKTYIAYKEVVAGQTVDLPVSDSWFSVMPLASSIEYVDTGSK